MPARLRPLLVALLGILLLAGSAAAQADDPSAAPLMPVDLTGVWNLDRMASDDLEAKLEPLAEELAQRVEDARPRQGYGDEEGMVSTDRSPRRGSRSPGDLADPNLTRDIALAMEQLLITVNGADVEIMDGSDRTRIWTPGARPVQREGQGGQVLEQAWWDGGVLVLSTTGGPVIITRRLHLEDDGKSLVVDVQARLSRSRQQAAARLVYTAW